MDKTFESVKLIVYGNGSSNITELSLQHQKIAYRTFISPASCKENCLEAWKLLIKTGGIVMPDDLILTNNFIEKFNCGIGNYESASLFSLITNPPSWYFCGMGIYFTAKHVASFINYFNSTHIMHDSIAACHYAFSTKLKVKHFLPTLTEHMGDISRANPGLPIRKSIWFEE